MAEIQSTVGIFPVDILQVVFSTRVRSYDRTDFMYCGPGREASELIAKNNGPPWVPSRGLGLFGPLSDLSGYV
jgi:hypothetical protein